MNRNSGIQKGVPVPLDFTDGKPLRGGWAPRHPFRDMEVGDYIEIQIVDAESRKRDLISLRNARRSKPKHVFAWKYGPSADPHFESDGKAYLKVWRIK